MRLSSNQKETLRALVAGRLGGMILKPIPSLIKRGLVVEEPLAAVPVTMSRAVFPRIQPTWTNPRYKLTPLGLEVYSELRKSWHKAQLKSLQEEYEKDISRAANMTRSA